MAGTAARSPPTGRASSSAAAERGRRGLLKKAVSASAVHDGHRPLDREARQHGGSLVGTVLKVAAPQVWVPALGFIFGGCCSNVYTLEVLVKDAPNCGHLVTFTQFLAVAAEGLRHHVHVPAAQLQAPRALDYLPRLRPRVVPLYRWLVMVALFFALSVLNNWALGYDISVPTHIIFRSGGLFVTMLLGRLVLKKTYSIGQIVSVAMVTAGVLITTLSVSRTPPKADATRGAIGSFTTGILLLSLAMFLGGWLGIVQETTYRKYGKQWREGLFYIHACSLPFFLIFRREILEQATVVANSKPVLLSQTLAPFVPVTSLLDIMVPKLALFLILNVITQYLCVSGVHQLTSVATSLTVTLVLNVRKFISLVLSVWYFGNPFGLPMKAGAALVFAGSVLYSLSGTARHSTADSPAPYPGLGDVSPSPSLTPKSKRR